MDKEMTNIRITFDVRKEGKAPPYGNKEMTAHIIFDIKLDAGFNRTARLITDSHKVGTPP